jgi:hypothetical protein
VLSRVIVLCIACLMHSGPRGRRISDASHRLGVGESSGICAKEEGWGIEGEEDVSTEPRRYRAIICLTHVTAFIIVAQETMRRAESEHAVWAEQIALARQACAGCAKLHSQDTGSDA